MVVAAVVVEVAAVAEVDNALDKEEGVNGLGGSELDIIIIWLVEAASVEWRPFMP